MSAYELHDGVDSSLRIGIVRESIETEDGEIRYLVEVAYGGRQIPVECISMTRFGGAHNYEEYILRKWVGSYPTNVLPSAASDKFNLRSGDVVVVAFLQGKSRDGVILGGLHHPARTPMIKKGDIEYNSRFNGIETIIRKNGSYQLMFHGAAINEALLEAPPLGAPVPAPIFNPLIDGSYLGFSSTGSTIMTDGTNQFVKVGKETKAVTIVSGGTTISVSGTLGLVSIQSKEVAIKSDKFLVSATSIATDSTTLSLKATQVSIGNDQIELIDGLGQLIDAMGTLTVTSPVGLCTPLQAAPQWAAQVVPLKVKLSTLKSSLKQLATEIALNYSADTDSTIS